MVVNLFLQFGSNDLCLRGHQWTMLMYIEMCVCVCVFVFPQSTVDKLIKKTNLALVVGTNSWREQFAEAITVNSGESSASEKMRNSVFDEHVLFTIIKQLGSIELFSCF